ncbi:MAG: hypothetical protein IPM23_04425 [Candidatus Melainabacteria bacterium]|nr:hypothetical protein [Candidatus Melainabacteria bacterium]
MRRLIGILGSIIGSIAAFLVLNLIVLGSATDVPGLIIVGAIFGVILGVATALFDSGPAVSGVRCVSVSAIAAIVLYMVFLVLAVRLGDGAMVSKFSVAKLVVAVGSIAAIGGVSGFIYSLFASKANKG